MVIHIYLRFYLYQKIKERKFSNNNSKHIKKYDDTYKLEGKCVIYTCITGNYDSVVEPLYINDKIEYVLFTDNANIKSSKWKIILIEKGDNPTITNRFIKMNPHKLFENYDYTIYVDGNVRIVSNLESLIKEINPKYGIALHRHSLRSCIYDEVRMCSIMKKGDISCLRKQAEIYRSNGFPSQYGLCECNVIVTNIKNELSCMLLEQWWHEFKESGSGRDQIALPYILWKNGISIKEVCTLGENIFLNPKFQVIPHINTKKKKSC